MYIYIYKYKYMYIYTYIYIYKELLRKISNKLPALSL